MDEQVLLAIFLLGYAVVFSLNSLRYRKIISYEDLDNRWCNEEMKTKTLKALGIICYALMSLYLLSIT
jgi:hypothetical protein